MSSMHHSYEGNQTVSDKFSMYPYTRLFYYTDGAVLHSDALWLPFLKRQHHFNFQLCLFVHPKGTQCCASKNSESLKDGGKKKNCFQLSTIKTIKMI